MFPLSPKPIEVKVSPGEMALPKPVSPEPAPKPHISSGSPKLSISKSYVIPPRPKPGRKPNSNSVGTKRKTQNRESQRSFRERKAKAVEELERQMAAQMAQHEKEQQALQKQIEFLSQKNFALQQSQPIPPSEPQPAFPVPDSSSVAMASYPPSPMFFNIASPPPLNFNFGFHEGLSPTQSPSPSSPYVPPLSPADVVGLELLDHVLEQKLPVSKSGSRRSSVNTPPESRRPSSSSPSTPNSYKVHRTQPPSFKNPLELINSNWSQPAVPLKHSKQSLETDFTTKFTTSSLKTLIAHSPPAYKDRCGFCTDDTVCICAQSEARESGAVIADDFSFVESPKPSSCRPHSHEKSAVSPLASEVKVKDNKRLSEKDDCTGNPLSCVQCKEDPMLTLFCSAVSNKVQNVVAPMNGTFIPTLSAYKTLTRHPGFYSADLSEIVNALVTKGPQIEVNSVAKVLRLLDTQSISN